MIYDTALGITWLQDAYYSSTSGYDNDGKMSWSNAKVWTDQLEYGGYSDWRLPKVNPINGSTFNYSIADNGSTDRGVNMSAPGTMYSGSTGSENIYMYNKN